MSELHDSRQASPALCPNCTMTFHVDSTPGACPSCGGLGFTHPVGAYLQRLFGFPGEACEECGGTGECPVCSGPARSARSVSGDKRS